MTASLIDQAADYAELKSSEHRLMVQRAFMAGALAVLTSKTPRNELIAECVAFGRAIGTQAEATKYGDDEWVVIQPVQPRAPEGGSMSREAFGDPPEQQEVPECCPNCGSDFYMPGCTHCDEVKRRCAAESEAMALRGQLGAASGWIVKALKVLDTVDPDDTDEAERLAALVKAGEVLALATLARSKTPNAKLTGDQRP